MRYVNSFCDGVSLKKGCGFPCSHLRCTTECEIAEYNNNPKSFALKREKRFIQGLIQSGQYLEALEVSRSLVKSGNISLDRYESFRLQHFSSPL